MKVDGYGDGGDGGGEDAASRSGTEYGVSSEEGTFFSVLGSGTLLWLLCLGGEGMGGEWEWGRWEATNDGAG